MEDDDTVDEVTEKVAKRLGIELDDKADHRERQEDADARDQMGEEYLGTRHPIGGPPEQLRRGGGLYPSHTFPVEYERR